MSLPYQKQLDTLLTQLQTRPVLLLHSCCAPCSSYVLQYLIRYFRILLFYYNPNISPAEEYEKRVQEQKRLLAEMGLAEEITWIEGSYEPQRFFLPSKAWNRRRKAVRVVQSVSACGWSKPPARQHSWVQITSAPPSPSVHTKMQRF